MKHFREWSIAGVLLVLLVVLAAFARDFYKPSQLLSMLTAAAPVLIAACGVSLVIICRQIDISIGSQFAMCSVLAGLAAGAGWPMVAVVKTGQGLKLRPPEPRRPANTSPGYRLKATG